MAKFAELAIDTLVKLMSKSRNDNIRLGAAKALLDKCLPDIKAVEPNTQQPEKIQIKFVTDKTFNQTEPENSKNLNMSNEFVPTSSL